MTISARIVRIENQVTTHLFAFTVYVTKAHLFKYIEIITSINWKFSDKKNSDIFHISAQTYIVGTR